MITISAFKTYDLIQWLGCLVHYAPERLEVGMDYMENLNFKLGRKI